MSVSKGLRYDKMFGFPSKPEAFRAASGANGHQPASEPAAQAANKFGSSARPAAPTVAEEPAEPPPPPVPRFSAATKPILDIVTQRSIRLMWEAQQQTGVTGTIPDGGALPPCAIAYELQMQGVRWSLFSLALACDMSFDKRGDATAALHAAVRR